MLPMLRRSLLCLLLIFGYAVQAAEPVIAHLTPPQVGSDSIAIAASCDRPRRPEGVNISVEDRSDKLIVHCYGHGGFGFTTLFGSIQEAIALLLGRNPAKETPIRVVGSGCMGLTMAIELYRQGFTSITISTKEKYSIPSWRAGGFFDPGIGTESSEADKHRLNLGLATYEVLRTIEQGEHPYLAKDIVSRLPIYYPADIVVEVEVLELLQLMPPSELVTLDFGNGVQHEGYKKQLTYFINITALMDQLWAQVKQLPITIVEEEVSAFEMCPESIVCNCTGLGSFALNGDAGLVPTRGHFFMLKQQPRQLADYMLFAKVMQNGKKEMIYFFPKPALRFSEQEPVASAGMLGGTFIPYAQGDTDIDKRDGIEFVKLAERAQHFFYGEPAAHHA